MDDLSGVSDADLQAIAGQSPATGPDLSGMSDNDLQALASGASPTSVSDSSAPDVGQAYRPGPGFSPLGDLISDIQGKKPQNVVSTNAPQSDQDPRNPVWAAVADIPSEIGSAASSAFQGIGNNLNPWSAQRQAENKAISQNPSFIGGLGQEAEQTLGVGQGLMSIPTLAVSPITGTARSVVGHALADTSPGTTYQQGKDEADILMAAAAPETKGVAEAIAAPKVPNPYSPGNPPPSSIPKPPSTVPVPDITQSAGQVSGDPRMLQTEQAARQGDYGPAAQRDAVAFDVQQAAQVQAKGDAIHASFDPTGGTPIDAAHEAGNLVSQSLQNAAQASKDNLDTLYETARSAPGAFDPSAFDGSGPSGQTVSESVQSRVTSNPKNVILDQKPGGLTPEANAALEYLNDAPQLQSSTGPSFQDVDQVRRNLLAYKDAAYANSLTDGKAASAIVQAFDDHVTDAAGNGLFNGPKTSVQAWNDARTANAVHQETFGVGKDDPVGKTVQQILGGPNRDPLTGNDVADRLFGATGTNPNTGNVSLVKHIQSIFPPDSPEISAIKQGMWSRIAEGSTGGQPWSHTKVFGNIDRFLNKDGIEMSRALYTPAERQMMQSYADMRKSLIPPPGTRNPSGTSPFVNRVIHAVTGHVGNVVGMMLGHHYLSFLPEGIREMVGAAVPSVAGKVSDIIQARKIRGMMPTTARALKQYQVAAAKATKNYGPQTAKTLMYTSGRLSNALAPLGIDLRNVLNQEKQKQNQNQDGSIQ